MLQSGGHCYERVAPEQLDSATPRPTPCSQQPRGGTSSGRHAQTYNTRVQSKVRSLANLAAASATCQPAAAARRSQAGRGAHPAQQRRGGTAAKRVVRKSKVKTSSTGYIAAHSQPRALRHTTVLSNIMSL